MPIFGKIAKLAGNAAAKKYLSADGQRLLAKGTKGKLGDSRAKNKPEPKVRKSKGKKRTW